MNGLVLRGLAGLCREEDAGSCFSRRLWLACMVIKSDPRLSILTQDARHLAAEDAVSFRAEPFGPELMAEGQPGTVGVCTLGGCSAKLRFSCSSCQTIRHMRRAMMVMAVLAFLPRSRCRL